MKQLKYFLMMLITIFTMSISSCDYSKNKQTNTQTYGVSVKSVKNLSIDTLSFAQLDSLTFADKLPVYTKWNKTRIVDDDTNKSYEYATLYDKTTGVIYTVKYLNEKRVYVVQKKKINSK